MSPIRVRNRFAIALAVIAASACGADRSAPVSPTLAQPAGADPESARAYVGKLLDLVQTRSINKDALDWASVRSQVLAQAASAQNIADTYPAIELALRLLDDHESYYSARGGALIGPVPVGGCAAPSVPASGVPASIGYVKVGPCDCQGILATRYAESIQHTIMAADHPDLKGWIVDLRGNSGGNMWPMIAGVGPVLGEGRIGYIIYYDREYEREYINGAALSLGEAFASVANPYTLLRQNPSVAVLTDGFVSSAGEAVTVFFKGRPSTRSFGTPTCGHHHLQEQLALSDGASLFLQTSQHADRTRQRYGGSIAPDELVADPQEAVTRAIAWLLGSR